MYCLIDFCCICFYNKEHLQHLSDSDSENITYLTKLTSCVPEMGYNEMNDQRFACNKCCETMDAAYKFRQTCLRSKTMFTDYISQLRTVSNISGAANVYLIDINKTDDLGKYQKENNIEVTKMFKNLNEDANDTENSVIKRELNPTSLKLFDTGENFIQLENVIIKMEQNYQISEEYEESSDNLSISENEIDVRQNFVSLTSSVIKEENKNQDFEENLQEKFDNILETSDNVNNDTATRLEKNYDYFLNSKKCADDLSVNLNEIKVEIVENDIESAKREINILSEVADIEGFSNDEHIFPLKDEDEADNDTSSCFATIETSEYKLSAIQNTDSQKINNNRHTTKKQLQCVICEKTFRDPSGLSHHIKSHSGENHNEYTIYQKIFTNSPLKTHSEQKLYKCNICRRKFTTETNLKTHMLIHAVEKAYECIVCQSKFTDPSILKTHMRTHTGQKQFACIICKQKFSLPTSLKVHLKIHTGNRLHECSICMKNFNSASKLTEHMRTHTGERPYTCNVCQNKFAASSTLKKHMRTHTRERPYECSVCQSKFAVSFTLKTHMKTHTGEKDYECSVCGKKFIMAGNLKTHMRTHTGERPYACVICQQKFSHSVSLKEHTKMHNEINPY